MFLNNDTAPALGGRPDHLHRSELLPLAVVLLAVAAVRLGRVVVGRHGLQRHSSLHLDVAVAGVGGERDGAGTVAAAGTRHPVLRPGSFQLG